MTLQGFVYAEDHDGARSLGFKLLAPVKASWSREVETLARKLQACPYPETWKPVELFCSVLLEDGQRLIAVARYGIHDHSTPPRAGGLELIGGVGPVSVDPVQARRIVQWLRERRAEASDPRSLAGSISMDGSPVSELDSSGVMLSLRLPASGTLLITGNHPELPDQHLSLLARDHATRWQWLPYCSSDFPFEEYSQRGPLVAWMPPQTNLALLLPAPHPEPMATPARSGSRTVVALLLLLLILLGVNAYAWWELPGRMPQPVESKQGTQHAPTPAKETIPSPELRERFTLALHRLLAARTGVAFSQDDPALREAYQKLVKSDPDLLCDGPQGQAAVALVERLSAFHPDRIARTIRDEFSDAKGFDTDVIRIISERVKDRLKREANGGK